MKTATTAQPSLKTTNRHQFEALAGRIKDVPPAELLEMILAAGISAVTASMDSRGSMTLPLKLATVPADMLPIFLPAPMVEKCHKMADVAEINGGADSFVSAMIGDTLESTAADILIGCWGIEDHATIAKLYEIQSDPAVAEPPTLARPEREAIIRGIARQSGMNEDELVRSVILD